MKTILETKGTANLSKEDVYNIIIEYLRVTHGYIVTKVRETADGFTATIDATEAPRGQYSRKKGRNLSGLAQAVREILNAYKAKNKREITFDALLAELKKTSKFENLKRSELKQYFAPSQIKRNNNLKGVRRSKDEEGLVF